MRNFDDRIENLGATAAGRLSAAEDNTRFKEMENLVSTFGITLDPQAGPDTDFTMLAQAASRAASLGVYGTCTGTANTYTVTGSAGVVVPKALFTGMRVRTKPNVTNTGVTTANVFGLGSKSVRTADDTALVGGELIAARHSEWEYDAAANAGAGAWLIVPWGSEQTVYMRLRRTQTIAHATATTVNFAVGDVEIPSTAPSRLTWGTDGIKALGTSGYTGTFFVQGFVTQPDSSNYCTAMVLRLFQNGTFLRGARNYAPANAFLPIQSFITGGLNANDIITMSVEHTNSGSFARNLDCSLEVFQLRG